MSDSVDRVFVHALNTVKRIPRTGSARPPPSARLKLYGLYKQSMEGDVERVMSRPPQGRGVDEAEREKWDAWSAQHGLSRTEAKRRYISTLIETMHQYASTTREARELVAELEFVWDQIKSNPVSSASSPGRNQGFIPPSRPTKPLPASAESAGAKNLDGRDGGGDGGGGGGLRMLQPPISDADHESADSAHSGDEVQYRTTRNDPPGVQQPGNLVSGPGFQTEDYDLRHRKWRKRIEQTLIRMTAELAALREQLESRDHQTHPTSSTRHRNNHHHQHLQQGQRRGGVWAWMFFFIVATARHLIIDAVALGLCLWLWRRSDARVPNALRWMAMFVREKIRRVEVEGWRRGRRILGRGRR